MEARPTASKHSTLSSQPGVSWFSTSQTRPQHCQWCPSSLTTARRTSVSYLRAGQQGRACATAYTTLRRPLQGAPAVPAHIPSPDRQQAGHCLHQPPQSSPGGSRRAPSRATSTGPPVQIAIHYAWTISSCPQSSWAQEVSTP